MFWDNIISELIPKLSLFPFKSIKKNKNLRKKISFSDLIVSHRISSKNSNVKIKAQTKMCRCKAILTKTSEIIASEMSRNIVINSPVNVFGRIIACEASVSVRLTFRSKEHEERWTRVKDRAKNGTSRLALVSFLARSFFAPKPNGNACYATQASRITSFEIV